MEDPHFEQVVNELAEIQTEVDKLIAYSVFTRLPSNVTESQAPKRPQNAMTRVDALTSIERLQRKTGELEDRLKELQDNTENKFDDQIEDYLNDLEEAVKLIRNVKNIVQPELLHDGESGKSEVSWLNYYQGLLRNKMHKEHARLEELTDNPAKDKEEALVQLKKLDRLLTTAGAIHDMSNYLQYFANRITEANDELPEFSRDFTIGLVCGWISTEVARTKEHEQNCFNVKSELESKWLN
ncbi:hypothetical protein M3Y94_00776500 [Aphelenchoides besseyi]|nr:hypothetical protein M3Y94_00776500 [Aphelenchoides besseyi]KAI6232315.1 hypothetical protein M3Y95_00473200 [Aphelenchoides besseyi]